MIKAFNPVVSKILGEYNIHKESGLLCLLGIYYGLDISKVIPETEYKSINLTGIIEKDMITGEIKWNTPLFEGEETGAWDWCIDWNDRYGAMNMARKDSIKDVVKRMKRFFSENPEYRTEDIMRATSAYIRSLSSPQFILNSAAFIYKGAGKNERSELLKWCENTKTTNMAIPDNTVRGKIL